MSLLWLDGMAHIDADITDELTIARLKRPYYQNIWTNGAAINTAPSYIVDPGPSTSRPFCGVTTYTLPTTIVFTQTDTLYLNYFFIMSHNDDSNDIIFRSTDGGTNYKCLLTTQTRFGTRWYFKLERFPGGPALVESPTFRMDTWYHVELKIVFSNTNGSIIIKVNGNTVADASGFDNVNDNIEYCNFINLDGVSNQADNYKNLIIYNESGTINNTWMGPVYIDRLLPSINGNFNDAVNSSGNSTNNYNYVATSQPLISSPTNYLSMSGSGDKQSYFLGDNFGDTNLNSIKSVVGFNSMHLIAKNGTSNINIKDFVGYNGSYTSGSDQIVANDYDYFFSGSELVSGFQGLHEINPDTSAQWQVSEITGIEVGYEITFTGI